MVPNMFNGWGYDIFPPELVAENISHDHGVWLVADEVMTSVRTGYALVGTSELYSSTANAEIVTVGKYLHLGVVLMMIDVACKF